jgi:hypothetical protein
VDRVLFAALIVLLPNSRLCLEQSVASQRSVILDEAAIQSWLEYGAKFLGYKTDVDKSLLYDSVMFLDCLRLTCA